MRNWNFITGKGCLFIPSKLLKCPIGRIETDIDILPDYRFAGIPPKPYLISVRYQHYFRITLHEKDYLLCEKYLYNRCYMFNIKINEYILQNCMVTQECPKSLQFIGKFLDVLKITE